MPCCVLQITYNIKKMMTMDIKKKKKKKKNQNRKSYLYKAKRKMIIKQMIPRGIEPGPAGWKSRSLTTNPQGMSTSVLHEDALLIGILSLCNHRETFQRFTVTNHLNLSLLQYVIMSCQLNSWWFDKFCTYGPCFSKDKSQQGQFSTVHPQ